MDAPASPSLRIDVWSDIACPWCWIGKRNLENALDGFGRATDIVWHSFELDRAAPATQDEHQTLVDHLARKYGMTKAQALQRMDRVVSVGQSVGIEFRFDRVQRVNTFDAHRLLHFASRRALQTPLKERLLRAYMTEGRRISDPEVLAELAVEVGLS